MGFLVVIVKFVIFSFLCKIVLRLYHFIKFCITVNKIPGPAVYPLTIIPFQFLKIKPEDRLSFFYNMSKKFPKGILRTTEAFDDVVVHIYKPHFFEVILKNNRLITKSLIYEFLEPCFGKSLLTSTGEQWFHQRKMINPAFHFEILNQFTKTMSEKAKILNQIIEENIKANREKPIDFFILSTRFAFDVVCETILGVNLDVQRNHDSDEYSNAIHKFIEISIQRINIPWLKWDWMFYKTKLGADFKSAVDTINKFTIQLIRKKWTARKNENNDLLKNVEELNESGKQEKKAFLDLLLDLNRNDENLMTDSELIEAVNTLLFGGYDTPATAINWVIFNLGNNLEIQEKVHQELHEIFGDSKEPAIMKQINELKYLERVIKESLRLNPPGPTIARRLSEDVELDEYQIPKGCIVHLQIIFLHRNPEVWPDPLKFDPDRFLPENVKNRHPYSYVPFSAGPRNCIGQQFAMMELKIVLTALLRKWRIKSARTPKEMKMRWNVVLLPHNGNPMYFIPK